jgi:hypothetical protein
MPTLHLIDADSSQACPAILLTVRQALGTTQHNDDRLLLLGGQPLEDAARQAGIDITDRIAVPRGKACLGLHAIKYWLRKHPGFDRVHCWSIGALQATRFILPNTPMQISLAHTPTAYELQRLKKIFHGRVAAHLRVHAGTHAIRDRLALIGVSAEIDPSLTTLQADAARTDQTRDEIRRGWGVSDPKHRVVALLSDHPSLVDATDAAAVLCLISSTVPGKTCNSNVITLVIHPLQLNRYRAQNSLASQAAGHRVVQDQRMNCPWSVLHGSDAALALGQDAGGLSLLWALSSGLPVITSENGPTHERVSDSGSVILSPTNAHKDLAHALQRALVNTAGRGEKIIRPEPAGHIQAATISV